MSINCHAVLTSPLSPPFPPQMEVIYFAGGCFWGIEEIFWHIPGVYTTFVGYSGGVTEHPTYEQVCQGYTGHAETVGVVYDARVVTVHELVAIFWQSHDPTQWERQGGDIGSQYRSAIYTTTPQQLDIVRSTVPVYQQALSAQGLGSIVTEIKPLEKFFYAEEYHQQYLAKNPRGYRCHSTTGVKYPTVTRSNS